jgi:regulator of replication initiation timing
MTTAEKDPIRQALERAMDDLLEGRVPGPLTGLRLVELAGVKRHRLTHDNPDLNQEFQARAKELNRTKPEVESLRKALGEEKERNARLTADNRDLNERLAAYATALLDLLEERDALRDALSRRDGVTAIPIGR